MKGLTDEVRALEVRLATLGLTGLQRAGEATAEHEGGASSALRARTKFLIDISQRMRTPLSGTLGMLELLEETRLTKKQRGFVDEALTSSRSLMRVFTEVIDFFQIESGELVLNIQSFDPQEVASTTIETYREACEAKGVELRFTVCEAFPSMITGDRGRLNRVLSELLENAVEHTGAGSISIDARVIDPEDAQSMLMFSVSDTGTGISSERLTWMFDLWNCEEPDREMIAIGLPATKTLVEAMGGKIDIESDPGEGTTVRFTLPQSKDSVVLAKSPLRVEPPQASPPRAEQASRPAIERRPARILVVEDDRVNQRVALGFLDSYQYVGEGASDGAQGLKQLEEGEFDLVLMDCTMPVMDGYEATRAIRMGEVSGVDPDIPIIALTADVSTEARRGCLEAGMNDYLTKPIRRSELDTAIRSWLPPQLRPPRRRAKS